MTKTKDPISMKTQFWILIFLIIILILGIIAYSIWGINPYLNRIATIAVEKNNISQKLYKEFQNLDEIGDKENSKSVTLNIADFNSLKKAIFFLKTEVDKELTQYRDEITCIVDRVNLYITLGIFLLTIFGVFAPILVQNFFRQETKEKFKELRCRIDEKYNDLSKLVKKSDEKIQKMESINQQIEEQKQSINNIEDQVINIPPLSLTYSLLRALDKDLIRWYITKPKASIKQFKNIFGSIKKDLEDCRDKEIFPSNNQILQGCLNDFSSNFEFVLVTHQGRGNLDYLKELNGNIRDLLENQRDEKQTFNLIIEGLDRMLKSF